LFEKIYINRFTIEAVFFYDAVNEAGKCRSLRVASVRGGYNDRIHHDEFSSVLWNASRHLGGRRALDMSR
jgi:hypothetical protein